MRHLRIGTRGSALALWQANHVRDLLIKSHGVEVELVRIRTSGDYLQTASVAQIGTIGVFTKELEEALLSGTVDLAVHSMKDVPTDTSPGLAFPAITKREDVRDCLITHDTRKLSDLPAGARVGTSSLRRQAQLRHHRHDLEFVDLRGNVDTRLAKVAAGEVDAVVLALAGVTRLGAADKVTEILPTDVMLPAVGQGALGIETRASDRDTWKFISVLNDPEARSCVRAERSLLRELQGGCQVPLGAWARIEEGEMVMEAGVFSPDGKEFVRRELRGVPDDPLALGRRLGQILIEAGADRILRLAGRSVG